MGQSNSLSENYLFLNVMVNFVIVNQKLTGSALHIEKNQTVHVLTNTHNLCFGAKIRKIGITLQTPFLAHLAEPKTHKVIL